MKILVLASPFSGARQFCNLLQRAGYDVGYGAVKKDGMVSELLDAPPAGYYMRKQLIYHLVSDPRYAVKRLQAFAPVKKHSLEWAECTWVQTVEYVDVEIGLALTDRIRIEHLKTDWPILLHKPKEFTRFQYRENPLDDKKLKYGAVDCLINLGYK